MDQALAGSAECYCCGQQVEYGMASFLEYVATAILLVLLPIVTGSDSHSQVLS